MKRLGIISTTVLFVFLGLTATVYAQKDEHEKDAKPAQQSQQGRSAQQGQRPQQPQQPRATQQQHAQHSPQARPAQQQHTQQAQQTRAPKQQAQQNRSVQQGQRNQQGQRVASNHGGRIPDDRFRANFGHAHMFRINRPTIVGGASRFQYGGYWFGFGQPWPVGWYYTDDVYVDYVDGAYFLYDPIHPGIRISIDII